MPILRLVEQRTINKGEVIEVLKQANTLKDLPSLEEYDQYVDDLWTAGAETPQIVDFFLPVRGPALLEASTRRAAALALDRTAGRSSRSERPTVAIRVIPTPD